MKTLIFDIETTSLDADTGILLCFCGKEYGTKHKNAMVTFRADSYPEWANGKRHVGKGIVRDVLDFVLGRDGDQDSSWDLVVAHNGLWFDRKMLATWAIKHRLWKRANAISQLKIVDPMQLSKWKMRVRRNSLNALIDFLGVPYKKTPIKFEYWLSAALSGHTKSLDYIVDHCKADVLALEGVYDKVRCLVKEVNAKGSHY